MTHLILLFTFLTGLNGGNTDTATSTGSSNLLDARFGRLYGVVVDRATREPLIGANVIVQQTATGGATDLDGKYKIDNAPVGVISVKISMVGYLPQVRTDIAISPINPTQLNIELESTAIELNEEIVVEGELFYKPTEVPTSLQAFTYEEIRRAPGAAADISRMIMTMPGVVQTTDQRNDLIVRGGSPAENLNLVDGFEIPNLNHFGTQGSTGGPIGFMQTEFISEATFMSGGMPARYGDKLSSVLDIRLRQGNPDAIAGAFELSMAGAGLILEGPLGANTTYLLNVRRSYLDLIFGSLGLSAIPKYSNLNAKVTHTIDNRNSLNLILLGGIDEINFEDDPDEKDPELRLSEETDFYGDQYLAGLSWRHLFDNKSFGNLYVWTTRNHWDVKVTDVFNQANRQMVDNESTEFTNGIKYEYSTYLGRNLELLSGASVKQVSFDYNSVIAADTNAFNRPSDGYTQSLDQSSTKANAFSQVVYKPTDDWKITAGARLNYFEALRNEFSIDPRVGASYAILPYLNLNASWGIFHQAPEFLWMFGTDKHNLALTYIKATHSVVGFDFYPDSDIKITLETYLKQYDNYPVSTEDSVISLANSGDDYGPNGLGSLISDGTGKSYGVDFFIQKKLTDQFYGLASYSWSRTRHQALDGVERPGSFDIPHVFTISGGYRFNESYELSAKYRFVSGRPKTPVNLTASKMANRLILDQDRINSERFPDYNRLDIRFDHRTWFDSFAVVSFFELQNVLGTKNVYSVQWNKYSQKPVDLLQWDRFFIGGVKVEF